ncbi:MAG TPA: histidinol-phosphate transaminase [Opitutaceae bacterium]|nr:histidinol-phosphate transaminase [Opitutaceae bacterium]
MKTIIGSPYRRLGTAALLAFTFGISAPYLSAGEPSLENSPTRLSSNENPFGYSPKAAEAMIKYLQSGNYYNHNEVDDLVKVLADYNHVKESYILPTPGSGPVLQMTALAYAKPGTNVVTTAMGYGQLINAYQEHGGDVKFVQLAPNMGYDFKALARAIDDKTNVVYICNPNNPTGVLADPAEMKKFIFSVPENILVFVDEAYLELSDTGLAANTMAPFVNARKNLLVSRTFSKGHAMAGLRAGYGIANPAVLTKLKEYYMGPMSYLAAIAAKESIKDQAHLEENRKKYQEMRAYTCKEFDRRGIKYAENPQGAFVYFRSGMKSEDLLKKLQTSNVLISGSRESGVPPGMYSEWERVSIGTKEQMDLFFGELDKALGRT